MKNWQSLVSGAAVRQSQEAGGSESDVSVEFVVLHVALRAVGAAAAAAGAQRVAALNHEILDDAVKGQPVVETRVYQRLDVCDVVWGDNRPAAENPSRRSCRSNRRR